MRALADAWRDRAIVQQLVGQLPWGHNIVLLTTLKDPVAREWYARAAMAHGWSRAILDMPIPTFVSFIARIFLAFHISLH